MVICNITMSTCEIIMSTFDLNYVACEHSMLLVDEEEVWHHTLHMCSSVHGNSQVYICIKIASTKIDYKSLSIWLSDTLLDMLRLNNESISYKGTT